MRKLLYTLFLILIVAHASAQDTKIDNHTRESINEALTKIYQAEFSGGKVMVDSIFVNDKSKRINLYSNLSLSYMPMREDIVLRIYDEVRRLLPHSIKKYQISIFSDQQEISALIPNFYRSKAKDKSRIITHKTKTALSTNISEPITEFKKGMPSNHIAMWQSHGWYYEQKLGRWEWQRARIFQTVEDLYTQSYVIPFLVPMLENAGANVLLPRERDYNINEVIADNDSEIFYSETNGKEKWRTSEKEGFANLKEFYIDGENPFRMGTAREIRTIKKGAESTAKWELDIPKKDKYAIYVAFQTHKNSSDDALYTVYHSGGKTEYKVNQQIGGGTWIFLGYFDFDKNKGHKVLLSNRSSRTGRIVSADAIKVGGGIGNIARMPIVDENGKDSNGIKHILETSGRPRYTEGARYWMQWAGIPDSIYNQTEGANDYTDDYASRGHWVNYLSEKLNVPIDLAFAFHTDAGTTLNDSIIGTLGIYMTHHNDELFDNNKSRWASRDLSEIIMDEIVRDIRRDYEPTWTRRALWNRSYAEARVPNVPTMLLELLSHQNFADMRYGLEPEFRFMVSRSIYKGMLKFLASQYNRDYVVQPLPVKNFNIEFTDETRIKLNWHSTTDMAEPTANPTQYIVYTRTDDEGFDNGTLVKENIYEMDIDKDKLYSFKVVAANEGGKSFPSEILSAMRKSEEKGLVLIVNGFTRTSAPFSFIASDSIAGFYGDEDNGVPYISEHHFIGPMREFRRSVPWMDDDASGFGDSSSEFETTSIAGNTFDYPAIHGKAFSEAGYSFVSCAASTIENENIDMNNYKVVDWILGKQRETSIARGAMPAKHKTFSKKQQRLIGNYCSNGGNIIVSGAFVGTDLWDNKFADKDDQKWAQEVLKYKWRNNRGAVTGRIKSVPSPFEYIAGNYKYYNKLNSEGYVVENPDAIEPSNSEAFTIFRYSENNLSAGVLYKGDNYSTCILGFPIESIIGEKDRSDLIKGILESID